MAPPSPPAQRPLTMQEVFDREGVSDCKHGYMHVASGRVIGKIQFFNGTYKAVCALHSGAACNVMLKSRLPEATASSVTQDLLQWLKRALDANVTRVDHATAGRELKIAHGMQLR